MSHPPSEESPLSFYIHKNGLTFGPFTQEYLLSLLQARQIEKNDLAYYEGATEWLPLDELFTIEEHITLHFSEGQNPQTVEEAYRWVEPRLGPDEEVYYIAHQRRKMMRVRVHVAFITNRRFIIMRQDLSGTRSEDCQWCNVTSVRTRSNMLSSHFGVVDPNGYLLEIEDLPQEQISCLSQLAQEMRE